MKETSNYKLKLPEASDFYNIKDFTDNFELIDALFKNALNLTNYLEYVAPTGYGLGGQCVPITDCNIAKSGFYKWDIDPKNCPFAFGTMLVLGRYDGSANQIAVCHAGEDVGCIAVRQYNLGVDSPWAFINPPMRVGVEYRTTKHYKGYAVYEKVDEHGNILWRAENEATWHLLTSANYIATASVE